VFAELLRLRLRGIVDLSQGQVAALEAHYDLLLRWNKTLNLTTITSLEEAVERHYCESLFLGAQLPAGNLRVVDVGSGAGFPGFPVGILAAGLFGGAGGVASAESGFPAGGLAEGGECAGDRRSGRRMSRRSSTI
jgi:hypothetical protein